jgi:methionyl-tRNA formyltransferase
VSVRTVFLGTSDFAASVLRRMADSAHRPALCVTPPDRPRGRGLKVAPPPAAEAARELVIEVLQTENVNEPGVLRKIQQSGAEIATVCAFGQLIQEPLLSALPMVNVHPSLVPRWRGAAPIERAIMARDAETGVSVLRVTAGLDSGPVALREATPIDPEEDYGSLSARLAAMGGELIVRALDLHAADRLEFTDQDEAAATYADKIDPSERRLDPSRPADELAATVRALTPHIGGYLELDGGDRLGVRRARAQSGQLPEGALEPAGGALLLGCADGVLSLEVVQPPGGKAMPADAYLRGHAPPAHTR